MYDLIIVGAGPVGSHLASKFSEKGNDVLVIEQSSEIGRPLACSGHVSPDIWDFVPEKERGRLEQNNIKGAYFHKNSDRYKFYKEETVSYVIDRVELDKIKAEEAKEKGVGYNLDEKVIDVQDKGSHVEILTTEDSYESKLLAGCDGASSTVRSKTDLPEPDHFYQGILCFSDENDSSNFVDVFLEVPEFFGWRIPRSDSVEYGAAVPKGEEPMKWLEKITSRYDIEKENICAGAIPVGPVEKSFIGRTFLVGDAAGQTKPFTGGGILYGMRCAEIAAECIDVNSPSSLEIYDQSWRNELSQDILLGRFIESFYSMPDTVQEAFLGFFDGEIGVHMDHPTSLFSWNHLKTFFR